MYITSTDRKGRSIAEIKCMTMQRRKAISHKKVNQLLNKKNKDF